VLATAARQVVRDLPAWLEELARSVDLRELGALCTELYGDPANEFYEAGDGRPAPVHCRDDSRRVADAYRAAGEPIPKVLLQRGGNVITLRRALCLLFGPESYERSVADPQTTVRPRKLVDVGCDRAVLLAMLAWAWGRPGWNAEHLRRIVAAAWPHAPRRSHGAPELHDRPSPPALGALDLPGSP